MRPSKPTIEVLVDARNVLRSQWPNIPARELVKLACDWADRSGVRAVVVFDGRAPELSTSDKCTVLGTKGESADEWLTRRASELRAAGAPFWLITSDRALREAAHGAERTIGGGSFANELRPARPGRGSRRLDRSVQTEPRAKPAAPDDGTASGAQR